MQGEFTHSDDTVEGRYHHRNVDRTRQRSRRNGDGDDEIKTTNLRYDSDPIKAMQTLGQPLRRVLWMLGILVGNGGEP
jgi:hypothetical protein